MKPDEEFDREEGNGGLLLLTLLACIVGAGAGAIGALFRLALLHADAWRDALIAWSHGIPIAGFVLVTASCAAAVAVAAWLVRRYSPEASGSGIPHVEAVLREELLTAYYCAFDRHTPTHVRVALMGALAYFIAPFDILPDLLPIVGLTDDAAVLAAVLKVVWDNIQPVHREAARAALARLSEQG